MADMVVTLDTSHLDMSLLNDDAEANMDSVLVTLDTSHLERSPLNNDAKANMARVVVTLDTSQSEMSPVNLSALGTKSRLNNMLMSVTAETSQDPIGLCGPLKQSADSCRHSPMASWSSALVLGDRAVVGYHNRGGMVGPLVQVQL